MKFKEFVLSNVSSSSVAKSALASDTSRCSICINCLNPHSFVVSREDEEFRAALINSDFLVIDGVGLAVALSVLSRSFISRVTGSDVFYSLSEELQQTRDSFSVLFLGSDDTNLALIKEKYLADYNNCLVVHTYSPPFKENFNLFELSAMLEFIKETKPDVVWLGLTAPKQEKVAQFMKSRCPGTVFVSIGAVFDFYSGRLPRAPVFVRRFGFEWLYRLFFNPRHLIKRTLYSAPRFLFHVFFR